MYYDIYLYTLCYYICCLLGACMRCTRLCPLKPGVTPSFPVLAHFHLTLPHELPRFLDAAHKLPRLCDESLDVTASGHVRLSTSRPGTGTKPRGPPSSGNKPSPRKNVYSVNPRVDRIPIFPLRSIPGTTPGPYGVENISHEGSLRHHK
jgi:hypothetical protein